MKTNLVESAKFSFTDEAIAQLSGLTGEDAAAVRKVLAQAVPLVLDNVLRQAEQESTSSALLLLARKTDEASYGATAAGWLAPGGAILADLLGRTYDTTVGYLAQATSLRTSAAERLLQAAATAVLGTLGRLATEENLLPSEFVRWLRLQKNRVAAAVLPALYPAGGPITPAEAFGAATPRLAPPAPQLRLALEALAPNHNQARPVPAAAPAGQWWQGGVLQWGLVLLLAMGLGYFFGRDRLAPDAAPAAVASLAPPAAAQPAGRYDQNRDTYIYDTGQPIILTLADGSVQKVGANSTENRLYTFLVTPAMQVDSVNRTKGWINFDRVYFESGRATLTPESAQQLHNVASILKSFPKAVVKIGGYTDSSGVAVHNFQLSEERAKAAMFTLSGLGIPADNLQFKGYGPKHFLTSNNTPAGRALNRRISVRVIKK